MKNILLILLFITVTSAANAQTTFVRLVTNKGDMVVMLSDETPIHKKAFLETIEKGLFKNVLFNRVIQSFVSQGGDLDDTLLNREKRHPEIPVKRIPAELNTSLFHKKWAFGTGRDENPDKSDYYTQIYIVAGKVQTDAQLDAIELKKNRKFPLAQREVYKTIGGCPNLDQNYNIIGEVVEGMDVADAINNVATNKDDVPLTPIVFSALILSKKETAKMQKKLALLKS